MKGSDIKTGETYLFVATDQQSRKHLEDTEFTVVDIRKVWRKTYKKSRQVKRYFNADGVGARAEELEPLDEPGLFEGGQRPESHYKDDDELPF